MTLTGTLTPRFSIHTFADGDSPDLSVGGLGVALADIDNALRYRGALTTTQFAAANYGLPTAPVDGDLVSLIVDASNGIEWFLRYVAAEATYKWRYLGGPELLSANDGQSTTTNAAYVDPTNNVSIVCPRAGDYDAWLDGWGWIETTNSSGFTAIKAGAAAAADADSMTFFGSASQIITRGAASKRITGAATSDVVKAQIKSGNGVNVFLAQYLRLRVKPVRIG